MHTHKPYESVEMDIEASTSNARITPIALAFPKLILPYEVKIESKKGTFTQKVETAHDVEILMQYLMPMNRLEPSNS